MQPSESVSQYVITNLHLLKNARTWSDLGKAESVGHGESSTDFGVHVRPLLTSDLHRQVGSPIPASLLRLILESTVLIVKNGTSSQSNDTAILDSMEKSVGDWVEDVIDWNNPSASLEYEDDIEETSSSSSDDEREAPKTSFPFHSKHILTPLTQAYHSTLLVIFFSLLKPTNSLLLDPLKQKVPEQLQVYITAVGDLEAGAGIASGILWPLRVLDILGLDKKKKTVSRLWKYVKGGGWKTSDFI